MSQNRPNAAPNERYEVYPSFVLGFHGCDREIGEAVLNGTIAHLEFSRNDYDWLGEGIYHTQICVRNLDCVLGYFRPL